MKGFSADELAALASSGTPPISGGTLDIELKGEIGALANDLLASVAFKGTTATIAGNKVNLDGQTLGISMTGPIDKLNIRPDPDFVQKVLVSAGKKKLFETLGSQLGGKSTEEAGTEGTNAEETPEDAGSLLKGLLRKKLSE